MRRGKLQYIIRSMHSSDARGPARHHRHGGGVRRRAAAARGCPARARVPVRRGSDARPRRFRHAVVNASMPALDRVARPAARTPTRSRARDQLKTQVQRPLRLAVHATSGASARGRGTAGASSASTCRSRTFATLPKAAPFSWATYELRRGRRADACSAQTLSKPAAPPRRQPMPGGPGTRSSRSGCTCRRASASRTRAIYDDRRVAAASRGNILTWEQRLGQRLEGKPIAYAEDTNAGRHGSADGPPVDPLPHAVAVRARVRRGARWSSAA